MGVAHSEAGPGLNPQAAWLDCLTRCLPSLFPALSLVLFTKKLKSWAVDQWLALAYHALDLYRTVKKQNSKFTITAHKLIATTCHPP